MCIRSVYQSLCGEKIKLFEIDFYIKRKNLILKYSRLSSGIDYNRPMKSKIHAIDTQLVLDKILKLLKDRNWSISQLAQYADLSDSTIYAWFNKKVHPSPESLMKICNACKLTLNELYAVDEEELSNAKLRVLVDACRGFDDEKLDALIHVARAMAQ